MRTGASSAVAARVEPVDSTRPQPDTLQKRTHPAPTHRGSVGRERVVRAAGGSGAWSCAGRQSLCTVPERMRRTRALSLPARSPVADAGHAGGISMSSLNRPHTSPMLTTIRRLGAVALSVHFDPRRAPVETHGTRAWRGKGREAATAIPSARLSRAARAEPFQVSGGLRP